MQDLAILQTNIADAVTNLSAYSFKIHGKDVTVTGEKYSDLLHASIAIDGKPWQGISCGNAHNLAAYVLKHITKELNNRSETKKGTG